MSPQDPGFAPAKVNLYLRVTGRRSDGFHLLDSLAVFAGVGDRVSAVEAGRLALALDGPEAGALTAEPDNLVLRAARALAAVAGRPPHAALHLEKHLPVASGIGGGSADAAAALRVLARLWGVETDLDAIAETLGADVPVCIAGRPARMRGVGGLLSPVPPLPPCGLVLANPRLPLATPQVFRARQAGFSAPATFPEGWADAAELAEWLRPLGNDLQDAAIGLCPDVAAVLAALAAQPGCLLVRMSGSGATCFGLFPSPVQAAMAASALPADWWRWGGSLSA
ncbi:4-(cytidine 5'-diphospho)-2-C-methyl-D-erythritol kinase [Falsiroseomonas sp.]|uniref:4-(cytidine 5'-diphospho)-2-C-methyl-D-erythritol kinase n=1 Tax=Falsiroseomonas sp. TaxID=2870721 RepID=UPI002735CBDB|nr:4-(cytidine 5'-diphospho)-2-C-methyl-D-erythritol kinase [Falsiroseomonas sp.]MDP3415157.1 4-(cytidine 5'-diphospho)-2-C-methyl-D-erythritol kinase [Falsiroseomonas sp.]